LSIIAIDKQLTAIPHKYYLKFIKYIICVFWGMPMLTWWVKKKRFIRRWKQWCLVGDVSFNQYL